MVQDKLDHLLKYIPMGKQDVVKRFIEQISSDMPEGKYDIDGEDIYAKIMSYPTKAIADCEIEAHDCYCDIQFTLLGSEGIAIFRRELLKLINADIENDFITFEASEEEKYIEVLNLPDFFTMIFPHEAHRPQESLDNKCLIIKKGVIKIKEKCYE